VIDTLMETGAMVFSIGYTIT